MDVAVDEDERKGGRSIQLRSAGCTDDSVRGEEQRQQGGGVGAHPGGGPQMAAELDGTDLIFRFLAGGGLMVEVGLEAGLELCWRLRALGGRWCDARPGTA